MKNKFVMSRARNAAYVQKNMDLLLFNAMKLARYDVTQEECLQGIQDEEAALAYSNFKRTFEYLQLDKDAEIDYHYLLDLHTLLMEGLQEGFTNNMTDEQIEELSRIINQPAKANTEIAIDAMLYILDKRLFEDGDIRVALMFANKIMLENGCGVITVPPMYDDDFREHLQKLNVTRDSEPFKNWVFKCCLRGERMS
ncbi:MAG TPA: hypothetical protein DCG51_09410 [Erysipelotrichaceae bacterium]|jgi:hypothetical protein|nr:hypothetical protein [Solobacterium sp.]HAE16753.1 hypothetical protein [Erysipelotrichaceae bacterium]